MVFVYEDESVRVVVHTANLVGSDWENRTQGVWVSPRLVILVCQFFCGRNHIFKNFLSHFAFFFFMMLLTLTSDFFHIENVLSNLRAI